VSQVVRGALFVGVGLYLLVGLVLYAMQDRLLYPAPGGISRDGLNAAAREIGAQTLQLAAGDGVEVYAWHLSGGSDRLVLYLHGNGEALSNNVPLYRLLHRHGWDVVAPAYRSYPGSGAAPPRETGLALDAAAAWRWAVGPGGYRPDRVVVHGRSLGGGVGAILVEGSPSARRRCTRSAGCCGTATTCARWRPAWVCRCWSSTPATTS
jgi:uncharacterized protein